MRVFRRPLAVLLNNWPQKLGAVMLAAVIWLFVGLNDTSTTQRSLFVPITVEGLQSAAVATGLPDFVEVTVAGPSGQIDRLRPENFEAILDLNGERGEFEAPIRVLSPQGVELRRVDPGDVIGTIEAVTEKRVPVDPVFVGNTPQDSRLITAVEPDEVAVRARASTLARVERVLAPLDPESGEVAVETFAVDSAGRPVGGVTVVPETVQVAVDGQQVLVRRTVPVELATPSLQGYTVTARLDDSEVQVVGPPSVLSGLTSVSGTVSLPTEEVQPGGYTLPVELELPEGVRQLEASTANVRLARPQPEP